jgi:hypothetical protein
MNVQGAIRAEKFSKETIKLLQDLETFSGYLQWGTLDPTAAPGVFGKLGCLYIRTNPVGLFQKTGLANTAWTAK